HFAFCFSRCAVFKERRAMDGAKLKCATDGIRILTSDLIDHKHRLRQDCHLNISVSTFQSLTFFHRWK
ncbi:hypothetical protein, partial [Dehalobacter sp. 12DCB1]|uniref:hypothetical protein n=1 Tax=Dehalobacter sp. 12DCB1 TaxID=2070364 RepID=UPI001A9A839B